MSGSITSLGKAFDIPSSQERGELLNQDVKLFRELSTKLLIHVAWWSLLRASFVAATHYE